MIKLINKVLALSGLKLEKINPEMMDGLFINDPQKLAIHLNIKTDAVKWIAEHYNRDIFTGDLCSYNYASELGRSVSSIKRLARRIGEDWEDDIRIAFRFLKDHCEEYYSAKRLKEEDVLLFRYRLHRKNVMVVN